MAETLIPVDGLLTVYCARNVEAALKRLPGVHHVDANYLNSIASVHYDEQQASLEKIRQIVQDCGYVCREETAHQGHAHHDHHGSHSAGTVPQVAATSHTHHPDASTAAAPDEVKHPDHHLHPNPVSQLEP